MEAEHMQAPAPAAPFWPLVLAAAAILMITMGARQSLGLFVAPLDTATGLGIASVSFAFAVSQFVWGAAQPVYGALAERWGTRAVITLGAVLVALGAIGAHAFAGDGQAKAWFDTAWRYQGLHAVALLALSLPC